MMSPSRRDACSKCRADLMTGGADIFTQARTRGLKLVVIHQVDPKFRARPLAHGSLIHGPPSRSR